MQESLPEVKCSCESCAFYERSEYTKLKKTLNTLSSDTINLMLAEKEALREKCPYSDYSGQYFPAIKLSTSI